MCTAITFQTRHHYFGRNLDLEYQYNEAVTITPRNYQFHFRHASENHTHFAIIGMATVDNDYPLYYDATNECGLSIAGLNFPHYAVYSPISEGITNIAPFELIPWVLCKCRSVAETKELLKKTNIANIPYSDQYPLSPLHWIIADKHNCIVVEPTKNGMEIIDNPVGVLTNSPEFAFHLNNLNNYLNVTAQWPTNRFHPSLDLLPYSAGMGGIGLPGDLSSTSRFVRAVFTKTNSVCDEDNNSSISQFFKILGSVEQQRGCVVVNNAYEKTVYSSCCDTDAGIYYYTTYENSQITAVSMHSEDLESQTLSSYKIHQTQQIRKENF